MRLLLNVSNLAGGGGAAVAASLLAELAEMQGRDLQVSVLSAPPVDDQATSLHVATDAFRAYFVRTSVQRWTSVKDLPLRRADFDAVLNLFGPIYQPYLALGSVMGLAQPWVAFPDSDAWQLLSRPQRVAIRSKYALQARFFRMAKTLVVEQAAIRSALLSQRRFRNAAIEVVPSAVDSIHWDRSRWQPLELPPSEPHDLKLGLISRNYPHKNIGILPEVGKVLEGRYGIRTAFYVTFGDAEWASSTASVKSTMINSGPLTLAQCPSFYRQVDAVVFPTLLECFSAVPIEARAAGVPLFASNLPVIRETVGDYATYFDPRSPEDIAEKIAQWYGAEHSRRRPSERLVSGVDPEFDPAQRAERLVEICRRAAAE